MSAKVAVGMPAWMPLASISGIPTSFAMHRAISSLRSASFSLTRDKNSPRSFAAMTLHAGKAAAAASTALLASATVPAGMVAYRSPVPELKTSKVSLD